MSMIAAAAHILTDVDAQTADDRFNVTPPTPPVKCP
jgi:hypothetical protein